MPPIVKDGSILVLVPRGLKLAESEVSKRMPYWASWPWFKASVLHLDAWTRS